MSVEIISPYVPFGEFQVFEDERLFMECEKYLDYDGIIPFQRKDSLIRLSFNLSK